MEQSSGSEKFPSLAGQMKELVDLIRFALMSPEASQSSPAIERSF